MAQYRSIIKNHIRRASLGGLPLGKVRRAHIRAHEAELEQKGLAAATRHAVPAVLSRGFAAALEDDLIAVDPTLRKAARGEAGAAQTPRRFTVWTADELRQLLEAAAGERLEALWRIAVATGARRAELAGLTWLGFAAAAQTLTISQQVVAVLGGLQLTPVRRRARTRRSASTPTRSPPSRRTVRHSSSSGRSPATPTPTAT
ncbi:MAG TPA: hypothetical protein VHZ77_10250 [Gaiellaceae bacterium]|nr:hypothetical protein [Gaiellaceae bacterium]